MMNNAIVESYIIPGSKLYATQYPEAGVQEAAVPTYNVSGAVLDLINSDPNISETARQELWNRYNANVRVTYFEPTLATYIQEPEDRDSAVEGGFQEEVESIQAARESFVDSLEGTEDIGYTR